MNERIWLECEKGSALVLRLWLADAATLAALLAKLNLGAMIGTRERMSEPMVACRVEAV
jgi:hypothetical protein